MISIQEALQILQDNLPEARIDTVNLSEAHGRYLAESISAPEPSPRYTNSAMDGYAVRWSDVMDASQENSVTLKVVGESRAGMPFKKEVNRNEAVHISTGAMLPTGADTVVRVEDTRKPGDEAVEILAVRCQGQDVRYEGEEFQCGDELLCACTKLSARQLALLATVGHQQVRVFAPPRISILVTGSELASVADKEIKSYQIRDSNPRFQFHYAEVRLTGGWCSSAFMFKC
jgi:molybdopterin molybdotransferase